MHTPNPEFMQAAIQAARRSRAAGDYAVGSIVAHAGRVIAASGNRTHLDLDATQHAELIVIRAAARQLARKNLSDCMLYSTHEPCPMCVGAVIWSRIACVVFGATLEDHKNFRDRHGNVQWRWRVIDVPSRSIAAAADHPIELVGGFMREECCGLFHAD